MRSGFIFIFALGLLGVIIALAFAMLAAARSSYASQQGVQAPELARLAVEEGTDHAIGVIRRQFDDGRSGIPTQLSDAWRSHFWPIDALKVGYHLSAGNQKDPLGLAFSPNDAYENDVRSENALTDPYEEVLSAQAGYRAPGYAYRSGYFNHPGCARWFEPGVLTADPVARPLSFHLPHPQAADAASADPAVRAGENYAPDFDQPMWYDSAFVPTQDAAQRRYRLRYAVAVEDLAGHLLVASPGAYDPSAVSVASGVPTDADRTKTIEVDSAVAERHAGAMSNIARYNHPSTFAQGFHFADLGLRGLGLPFEKFTYSGVGSVSMLARWQVVPGGKYMANWCDVDAWAAVPPDEPDRRINQIQQGTWGTNYFSLGPIPSFHKTWWGQQAQNHCYRQFLLTPFGRVPEAVPVPSAWHHGFVDTPWRINLPTAAPKALIDMVYAYMPSEFLTRTFRTRKVEQWDGSNWVAVPATADDERPLSNPHVLVMQHVALFRDALKYPSPPWFADHGGVPPAPAPGTPYPGTDTSNLAGWETDLGKGVATNELLGPAAIGLLGMGNSVQESTTAQTQYASGYGSDGYLILESKAPVVRGPGGTHVSGGRVSYPWETFSWTPPLVHPWSGYSMSGLPFSTYGCYRYGDSYWLDLHVAMLQALALAQYAWVDATAPANAGDPDAGRPRWPAGLPTGYFPPPFSPGALTRDRDVDGDGVKDVPSAFDTVREVDAQFLRNLGEDPAPYALTARPTDASAAIRIVRAANWYEAPRIELVDYKIQPMPGLTIKAIRTAGKTDQAALMELVVNDMRMSFFGASPSYADFRPLDLDDDGTVRCSCYAGGSQPAIAGEGPPPERRFSLTGYVDFQKSRYYRIFVRGEVFDELRGVTVAQDNLETVYAIDPDGDVIDGKLQSRPQAGRTTGMSDSHVLYQRHLRNRYLGLRSAVQR